MSLILTDDDPIVIQTNLLANQIKTSVPTTNIIIRPDVGHCVMILPDFCIKCVVNKDGIIMHCPPITKLNNYDFNNYIGAAFDIIICINLNVPFDKNYYTNYLC